ncbi:DUF92 domain-containing protein [Gracilimonas sediminicola]|uniref:DUF92 domain-containing protein n=1 Tax=Gracilimonas sediminicola TaxID=2952158 RepID=A0A9X2L188_9BACT|nr:DUF92 domain-containing protein [Gracilimonas sediminicola]
MLDRWVNIFFSLALVFVFILFGDSQQHNQILFGLFLAALLSITAFILNWLTIDGASSATIFGGFAYGLGGLAGAAVVLAFFISGSVLSKDLISREGFLEKKFRRNGKQVWSNGFWFVLWILIWFLTDVDAFLIGAVTSIATAASDTWATEIGENRLKGKTRLITTGEKVQPGTDGGISFYGTVAALTGAAFIAAVFWFFAIDAMLSTILIIAITGFFGSLIDSYIGARFQNVAYSLSGLSSIGLENMYVSNNFVNWISAGLASVISLILILIIGV